MFTQLNVKTVLFQTIQFSVGTTLMFQTIQFGIRTHFKCQNSSISRNQCSISKVWFSGISTIIGYLMPNPVFTYLLNIWFVNTSCRCRQLNDQIVLFLTIQFRISYLFAHRLMVGWLVDWLFCFTAYRLFSDPLTPN